MSEHKWESSPYSRTCQMFEAWGIDPTTVSVDSPPDEDGYWEFQRTEDGRWAVADDVRLTIFREWPAPEAGTAIVRMFRRERGY